MNTYLPFLGPALALLAGLFIYALARMARDPDYQLNIRDTLDETLRAVEEGHQGKPPAR